MTTYTHRTTYGELEFNFAGQNMTVRNCDTGQSIYSGDPDTAVMGDDADAQAAAQEFADDFYEDAE